MDATMVATQDPELVGNPAQEQGKGPNQPDGVPPMRLDPTLEFPTVGGAHTSCKVGTR